MTRFSALALALLVSQAGCTVTAATAQGDTRPTNTCQSDGDCPNQHCNLDLCQALNGQLEGLLVTVTPASDSAIPHLTFVEDVQGVPTSGGERDLLLPGPSHLTGSLQVPKGSCYPTLTTDEDNKKLFNAPDNVSLPATVTLSLHQSLLGLPQQVYFTSTGSELKNGGYSFDVQVPAGEYEVYLVPPRKQDGCVVPPQVVRSIAIPQGAYGFPFVVGAISTLTLDIHWPKTASVPLTGWLADIIEPLGGRPISTEVALAAPMDPGESSTNVEYSMKLVYSPVVEPEASDTAVQSANDLFRLRPPPGVVAPTIFLDRSALGLFAGSTVDLGNFTRIPAPVKLEGQVAGLDDHKPVSGNVTLISTAISGMDPGIFGSFQTIVQVGDDGLFEVELPPGQYRVQAVPPMPAGIPPVKGALSAIEVLWDVPADIPSQAGKVLELPLLAEVTGQARIEGAQVQAVPSPQTVLPFEAAFGAGPFAPRSSTALVDESGHFRMQADPGQFDVSVQASESLGFGWFVRAGVQVDGAKTLDLGHTTLPVPSVLTGKAKLADATATFASAAIRAYAYLDKDLAYTRDPKQAVSVVAVAETRAKGDGTFRLLVPSSIAAPK